MADRRAQAALEFLSTYGAAFLILLVALGVLSYTGLFNIASLRSDECNTPPGVECKDFTLNRQTPPGVPPSALNILVPAGLQPYLRVVATNTYGVNLTITNATLTGREFLGQQTLCRVYSTNAPSAAAWPRGNDTTLWCPVPAAAFRPNQRYDLTLTLNFTQPTSTWTHTVKGAISVKSS